jgi:hypothetical protein
MRRAAAVVLVASSVRCLPLGATLSTMLTARPSGAQSVDSASPRRLWSILPTTWIYRSPRRDSRPLGSLRPGTSVRLRDLAPVRGGGCAGLFYAVEPAGFVCLDRTGTLDSDHRRVRVLADAMPATALLPYRYALSNGAPAYRRLPSPAEWKRRERDLGPAGSFGTLSFGNRGHELLVDKRAIGADSPVPGFLLHRTPAASGADLVKKLVPLGSTVAYSRAFEHEGRVWLLTSEGLIVPADRVRPYRTSRFAGQRLDGAVGLPLAWARVDSARAYVLDSDGSAVATERSWSKHSVIRLAGDAQPVGRDATRYLATREKAPDGRVLWIREQDACVARRSQPPDAAKPDKRWLAASITQRTLVAYEGKTPVFATLIAPGAGGVPRPGTDLVKASTTPVGTFRITYKVRATTMSPEHGDPQNFWLAEVPYTQYFSMPFALHASYWHDSFGEWMSAGCINVSPEDGRWLFDWTVPTVPDEWNGAASSPQTGMGTVLVVTR